MVETVSTAASAVAEFAVDNWKDIAAGIAVGLGCAAFTAVTAGAGALACGVVLGAAASGITAALDCPPGQSIAGCAVKGAAIGAVTALGGAALGKLAKVGVSKILTRRVAAEAAAGDAGIAEGLSRGGAGGHGYARSVTEGGRPDGDTVFAGHGSYSAGQESTIVPEGTVLKTYGAKGSRISDELGHAVERGDGPAPYETFNPGDSVPNYVLRAPDRLKIMSASTTVEDPTPLSDLLQPNMGVCHFAACMELGR